MRRRKKKYKYSHGGCSRHTGKDRGERILKLHVHWEFNLYKGVDKVSCRLSRQLQIVKTVADCQDSCTLSIKLKTVKSVSDCQHNHS